MHAVMEKISYPISIWNFIGKAFNSFQNMGQWKLPVFKHGIWQVRAINFCLDYYFCFFKEKKEKRAAGPLRLDNPNLAEIFTLPRPCCLFWWLDRYSWNFQKSSLLLTEILLIVLNHPSRDDADEAISISYLILMSTWVYKYVLTVGCFPRSWFILSKI